MGCNCPLKEAITPLS